ncbi:uncharacterized protein LOC135686699 isoform X2 [Rhopilema esculentum]|uniref:uncharacterized protein LOC135686699 isoform X2 n=1 Tax=Rhopilema esculentum TaxID=499914 RepID=UPI0031DB89B4
MDISQRADCNNMSAYDYQRQTYVWNYLDGSQRGDMCDKPKIQSPVAECYPAAELDENETSQMKTPSIYNLSRENAQRSMAVTNWGSPSYPRHGFSHCEAARGYSENASPSCMFSAPRVHYQHYVNHARSQFEWIHDLTQDYAVSDGHRQLITWQGGTRCKLRNTSYNVDKI